MTISSAYITDSLGNVYTSSGNTAVTWLSINNYSASSNAIANVHVVASGGSANTQNLIMTNVLVVVGDQMQIYTGNEKLILSNGDMIQAVANTNSILNAVVSYTSV